MPDIDTTPGHVATAATSPTKTTASRVKYLDTIPAYDLWAQVYDTDNNFLQALDTFEMQTLLPQFLTHIDSSTPQSSWKLVDLGCGTGRNTALLARHVKEMEVKNSILGLDPSEGMLDVARKRLQGTGVRLGKYDILSPSPDVPVVDGTVDGVISTLVVEHVPLDAFFGSVGRMVRKGGMLLVTNMHEEMGGISQAGFVDPGTGEKVRPTSYAHSVGDVVREGKRWGFEVVGDVLERKVDESMVEALGPRARKWVGVRVWYGICFRAGLGGGAG